ncbi:MAG: flagellar hook protein FlgE [Bacillota bacterium]|jgi:flagellar hook protein FlgE
MMRSMFAGVSGTRAHQVRMDVIGNNIANVNTVGYKYGRATFQDMLSQTVRGSMAPTENRGGVDPMQVGLGTMLRSIDIVFTPGNLESTGKLTDMAIQGNGFFVVRDSAGGLMFTRDGAFKIDAKGNLVHPSTGYHVQGWKAAASDKIDRSLPIESIDIPLGTSMSAKATDDVWFVGNLEAGSPTGTQHSTSVPVYDSQGLQHTVKMEFTKTANTNEWTWKATSGDSSSEVGSGVVKFKSDGAVSRLYRPTGNVSLAGDLDAASPPGGTFAISVYDSHGVQHDLMVEISHDTDHTWKWEVKFGDPPASVDSGSVEFDATTGAPILPSEFQIPTISIGSEATIDFTLNLSGLQEVSTGSSVSAQQDGIPVSSILFDPGTGASLLGIKPDFASITQVGDESSVSWSTQSGYPAGSLETFNIDDRGTITGVYSNGQYKVLGQMVLASFANSEGLMRQSNNMYAETTNSGAPQLGEATKGGRGSVLGTTLEMSNVDLAREFTDMIVTQRGFQANSRVITAADEMLQELLALKR